MRLKPDRLYFAVVLVLSLSVCGGNCQELEGLWEEDGEEDELSLIIESAGVSWIKLPSGFLGFKIPIRDISGTQDESGRVVSGAESMRKYNIRLSSRGSGERLGRQLLRGGLDYGSGFSLGFITERDSGEDYGDFYLGYISCRLRNITGVLGGYSAGMGQGLVLWRGFDWGAYAERPMPPLKADFLRGYASTSENGALVGGAVSYTEERFSWMVLYSDARWDASGNEEGVVTVQTSGLHNTSAEKANRDRLRERLCGGRARFSLTGRLSLGASATLARYNPPFAPDDSARRTFDFAGDENVAVGTDFTYESEYVRACGEAARVRSGGTAGLIRLQFSAGAKAKAEISGRNYSQKYKNLRSVAPAGNEIGYTFAASVNPWKGGEVKFYGDIWRRPWRTYVYDSPPEGRETSLYLAQRYGRYYLGLRARRTFSVTGVEDLTRDGLRFRMKRDFGRFIGRFRVEWSESDDVGIKHKGFLISCGSGGFFHRNSRFEFDLSYFNIPDYDCRIYQYEYDVPG